MKIYNPPDVCPDSRMGIQDAIGAMCQGWYVSRSVIRMLLAHVNEDMMADRFCMKEGEGWKQRIIRFMPSVVWEQSVLATKEGLNG